MVIRRAVASTGQSQLDWDGSPGSHAVLIEDDKTRHKSCRLFLGTIGLAAVILLFAGILLYNEWPNIDGRDGKTSHLKVPIVEYTSASSRYRYAAVSADNPLCSSIGTDILARHGGSTVDAAIATVICQGLMNPHHVGLTGGHLMVVYERPRNGSRKEMDVMVARKSAPLWMTPEFFKDKPSGSSERGPLAINVPAEIKGYHEAWTKYGRVPWAELFRASIKQCHAGCPVTESLAESVHKFSSYVYADSGLREAFTVDGELVKAGYIRRDPKLCRTLERVAAEGVNTFYNGSLARDLLDDIKDVGGKITQEDLVSGVVSWEKPVEVSIGEYRLQFPPPPSTGLIIAFILKVMQHFKWDIKDDYQTDMKARAQTLHRFIQAWKIGGNLRGLAVRDSKSEDIATWIRELTSDELTKKVATDIASNGNVSELFKQVKDEVEMKIEGGTTHVNVLAPDGSAVSMTSTVGNTLGCKHRGARTGLILNNGMSSFERSHLFQPRKRTVSSTSPVMVLDKKGRVLLLCGASGSQRIITSLSFVLANIMIFNHTVQYAVSQPRVHTIFNLPLYHDEHIPQEMLRHLRNMGHDDQRPIIEIQPYIGVNQVIDNRACLECGDDCKQPCIEAVCDWRKVGKPDGF